MGDYPGHPFRGNQFTKGEGRSGRYDSYEEAAAHARDMATTHKMDVGIRRTKEYGKEGFNVAFLPKESHRYGSDLQAEVVRPGDPQSKFALEHIIKQAADSTYAKNPARDLSPAPTQRDNELRAKLAIESYNKATRPNVLRSDHESHRASQQARAAKGRLRRTGARYYETEDGKLRPGRKLSGRY